MGERFIDEKALYPTMDILCEIGEICVEESKWHISAERAVEKIRKCLGKPDVIFSQYRLEKYIDEHPIEVKPVVHAHWEEFGYKWRCSACGARTNIDGTPEESNLFYCPLCGAKMDEEV